MDDPHWDASIKWKKMETFNSLGKKFEHRLGLVKFQRDLVFRWIPTPWTYTLSPCHLVVFNQITAVGAYYFFEIFGGTQKLQ